MTIEEQDIADAAILMTLLHIKKRRSQLLNLISGWDMLQADVPSRERFETAASILVGSGLAEMDDSCALRLTEEGERIKCSVDSSKNMRTAPGKLEAILGANYLARSALVVPEEVFVPVLSHYCARADRRRTDPRLVERILGRES